jgi:hypothetical protein
VDLSFLADPDPPEPSVAKLLQAGAHLLTGDVALVQQHLRQPFD